MKLVGINGSLSEISYNRKLLQFIQSEFDHAFDLEILDLHEVPMFKQFEDQTEHITIDNIYRKINNADGVIIATPEHSHTVAPAVKNIIEHLSVTKRPFQNKPVLVIGASYYEQGSGRAQLDLKQILEAPGVNAYTMPGNEFLLSYAREAFDENGRLKDESTTKFLASVLGEFKAYVEMITELKGRAKPIYPEEDLTASEPIATTIDVDPDDDDWVEKAASATNAAEGSDYVKLNHGVLTVDQLNYFLESMPMELAFADENNQFLYYNHIKERSEMLAGRDPEQVGQSLHSVHPESAHAGAEWVIQELRNGAQDRVVAPIPIDRPEKHIAHFYQAMRDSEGNYRGVNEYIFDVKKVVDMFLEQTNQKLVAADGADAVSGATDGGDADAVEADSTSAASE